MKMREYVDKIHGRGYWDKLHDRIKDGHLVTPKMPPVEVDGKMYEVTSPGDNREITLAEMQAEIRKLI